MVRENHRQRYRAMAAAALQCLQYGPFARWGPEFEAMYPSVCRECGTPIEVGDLIYNNATRDEESPRVLATVHSTCPSITERFGRLFEVDGDLVLGYLEIEDKRCAVCGRRGGEFARVMQPDGWVTYKHRGCVRPSGGVAGPETRL